MTVAAFFRDARVQGAMSGDKSSPAAGLIGEFFSQYGFAECTPQQLLALSDLALRCGDQAVARDALDCVVQSGQSLHLAFYKLGRLALLQNEPGAAARHFHLGTEAGASFAFNWMGEARALHAQGLTDAAIAPAERFLGFGVKPHAAQELTVIAELGDRLFDAGQRRRCQKFYEFVVRFGAERPRDAVRLAEILAGFNDHAAAQALLLDQQRRDRLDHWGQRELALSLSQTGDHARAIELAEAAMVAEPSNGPCQGAYIDVVVREGDAARINDALTRHAALLGRAGTQELQARQKMAAADLPGAAAQVADLDFGYQSRLYYFAYELAYAALAAGQADLALALSERLAALAPRDIFITLLRVEACFRHQMWERAAELLAGIPAGDQDRPQVVLKRFELACFTGDGAQAEALRARLDASDLPSRQFMLPVFRFLAERQQWNDIVDRALPWLDRQFNYRQIGYVLFRAAKYTNRQADMIAAVEAVENWADRPDLVKFRASLALDAAADLPAIELLGRDPTIAGDALFRRRLDIRRGVQAAAETRAGPRALVLCSDRNYLCGTAVALYSIMQSVAPKGLDIFVVVDDDLAELAGRMAEPFAASGLSVTVLPAARIVPEPETLSPEYGIFTSGHKLAAAAYYRIFAAQHIQQLGLHDRALYLDSDILARGRLDPLFDADMNGHPLAAKCEPLRPEVRRAIALHGLENNRYFNSGVLLFDLRNDNLVPALNRSIAAITGSASKLLFHDQCALNLGFRSDFADLEETWNTTISETTRPSEVPAGAVVWHFLDRPKPWSAAYGGDAGLLWSETWRETAAFIGEALALELFALIRD